MERKERRAVLGARLWARSGPVSEWVTPMGIHLGAWDTGIRICSFDLWSEACPLEPEILYREQYLEFLWLKAAFEAIGREVKLCDRCRPGTPPGWIPGKLYMDESSVLWEWVMTNTIATTSVDTYLTATT